MANPSLLHLPLRENLLGRDRNGVVSATAVGPVRFSADGYEAEEGTTNYVANPVAANDLSNMFIIGSVATRVTDQTDLHATAVRAVTNGSVSGEGVSFNVTLNTFSSMSARTFIGSLYAKGSGNIRVHTRLFYTDATTEIGAETLVTLTSTPQRIVTPTVVSNMSKTLSHAYVLIRTNDVLAITFWASKAQIEEKAYATSYTDGSLGTGYSWAGTAHASASTRQGTALVIDPTGRVDLAHGEIHVRVAYGPSVQTAQYALHHINGTHTRLYLLRTRSTGKLGIGFGSNGNFATEPGSTADRVAIVHGLSWDGTDATHYKDLAAANTGSVGTGLQTLTSELGIGGLSSGGQQTNGLVSDLMIFDRPLTDAERANLAATPEWSFDVLADRKHGAMSTSIVL